MNNSDKNNEERTFIMKAFLEEYGVIIVAVIVILLVIGVATIFGDRIREAIISILDTFMTQAETSSGVKIDG